VESPDGKTLSREGKRSFAACFWLSSRPNACFSSIVFLCGTLTAANFNEGGFQLADGPGKSMEPCGQ